MIAGPCHKCRECNIGGKCKKGVANISCEGAGMDVYGLLDKMGIEYEHPVKTYLTMVSMVMTK